MKKYLYLFLLMFIMISCYDAGTKREGFSYCVMGNDTIDFVYFYPRNSTGVWVGKSRNTSNRTVSLTYSQGKVQESVIYLEKNKANISGTVILENDSIIIIKKN
jgi:hypothetical protein